MAIPALVWTLPVDASPATTADSHHLNNDIVAVSDKHGNTGTFAPGGTNAGLSGKYMVSLNDVDRVDVAAVPESSSGEGDGTPAHSIYTYTNRGHISLNGGVFELLPYSAGVKGGTTTYTDFAGTGRSPYPENYVTAGGTANSSHGAAGTSNNPGPPICGTTNYQNVESHYTYTTATVAVGPASSGTYSHTTTPLSASLSESPGPGGTTITTYTQAQHRGPVVEMYTGAHSVGSTTIYQTYSVPVAGSGTEGGPPWGGPAPAGWSSGTRNVLDEVWTIGGTFNNGTSVTNHHKGAIHFRVVADTECEISSGNIQKTVTGTANWANGQSRTVTITATNHGLVDSNNRIYISGASNNAINGIWNIASVTNSSQFTTKIFAANCEDGGVDITGLNIITYDGIDKSGGVLRQKSGLITSVVEKKTQESGSSPATHKIEYEYTGSHGVASSGQVTVQGTVDYDFTSSVTRTSGTVLTRAISTGNPGATTSTNTIWANPSGALVYPAENDLIVIGGGMYGNNKVIIKGTVTSPAGEYVFCGNTSTSAVHHGIIMSSSTRPRSMFTDAKLNVDHNTGRVYTTGAPSTQQTDSSGGFNGVEGGMAPIDSWCPHYMHGRAKAQESNDLAEVLKANTSAFDASTQMLNSPLTDSSGDLTTYMHPREGFHQTIHFTLQAYKNNEHTSTRAVGSHTADSNDYVNRDFHINVHHNMKAAKNDFIVTYPTDTDNNFEVANTDTAMKDVEEDIFQSNNDWLANSYSNGTFSNL